MYLFVVLNIYLREILDKLFLFKIRRAVNRYSKHFVEKLYYFIDFFFLFPNWNFDKWKSVQGKRTIWFWKLATPLRVANRGLRFLLLSPAPIEQQVKRNRSRSSVIVALFLVRPAISGWLDDLVYIYIYRLITDREPSRWKATNYAVPCMCYRYYHIVLFIVPRFCN